MNVTTRPTIKGMSPQFLVTDLSRSIDYYTRKLGFEVDFLYEQFYAGISRDGHSIHLKLGKPTAEERTLRRKDEHLDVTFTVEGIDAIFSDFQAQSIDVVQSPRNMPYGREFYICDPDGYLLAFVEPG